jgi:hypothetical protein
MGSVCTACQKSKRNCTYQSGQNSIPRRINNSAMKQETVQRSSPSTKGGPADPLRDPILTKTVWDEIHNIFKIHFSTEMPFLHPPTFRILMRQGDLPLDLPISPTSNRHNRELLLLGILTLTARFHRELVAYHTQSLDQEHCPLAASEYYAPVDISPILH